jgi:uncharacterized membrane protein
MHWHYSSEWGWLVGVHLLWWVLLTGVVAMCVWAFSRATGPAAAVRSKKPMDALRRRYAEGAITMSEYDAGRAKLLGPAGGGGR